MIWSGKCVGVAFLWSAWTPAGSWLVWSPRGGRWDVGGLVPLGRPLHLGGPPSLELAGLDTLGWLLHPEEPPVGCDGSGSLGVVATPKGTPSWTLAGLVPSGWPQPRGTPPARVWLMWSSGWPPHWGESSRELKITSNTPSIELHVNVSSRRRIIWLTLLTDMCWPSWMGRILFVRRGWLGSEKSGRDGEGKVLGSKRRKRREIIVFVQRKVLFHFRDFFIQVYFILFLWKLNLYSMWRSYSCKGWKMNGGKTLYITKRSLVAAGELLTPSKSSFYKFSWRRGEEKEILTKKINLTTKNLPVSTTIDTLDRPTEAPDNIPFTTKWNSQLHIFLRHYQLLCGCSRWALFHPFGKYKEQVTAAYVWVGGYRVGTGQSTSKVYISQFTLKLSSRRAICSEPGVTLTC